MMQHTQTHNHQRNKKNREKFTEDVDDKLPLRKQQQRRALPPPPLQTTMLTPPHSHKKLPSMDKVVVGSWHSLPELPISPVSPTYNQWAGGVHSVNSPPTSQHSPVSLVHSASPSSVQSPDEPLSPFQQSDRRLSVAELCNPVEENPIHSDAMFLPLDERISLTKDEYEALEGLTQFQRIWTKKQSKNPPHLFDTLSLLYRTTAELLYIANRINLQNANL